MRKRSLNGRIFWGFRVARTLAVAVLTFAVLQVGTIACTAIPLIPDAYELMMPMRDGVRLYTCGTAPRGKKKCPVIVVRTPYVEETGINKTKVRMMAARICPRRREEDILLLAASCVLP